MNTGLIFFRISRYLRYIALSRNRNGHGIHSPFVFDLISRVLGNKSRPAFVSYIERLRRRLIQDRTVIEFSDLGAGSDGRLKKMKRVSDIVKSSAIPEKYGLLLSNMSHEFGKPCIVEFGTSLGISTIYLAASCTEATVITMEGSASVAAIAENNFSESGLKNIRLMIGPFEECLKEIVSAGIIPGLVFLDGNHRKKPVLDYFDKLAEISDQNSVIIIDDIYYSNEMEEAWSEIKKHEKVSLTIDIFRMGIVFFRKGYGRNDYMVMY